MVRVETAVKCFQEGQNCAQALLSTYGTEFGLGHESALSVASCFVGGICFAGGICGAVTGALMVIGLQSGCKLADPKQSNQAACELGQKFIEEFKRRHQSCVCRELIHCDISTPELAARAERKGVFATVCAELVRAAAQILDEMYFDGPSNKKP